MFQLVEQSFMKRFRVLAFILSSATRLFGMLHKTCPDACCRL